MRIIDMNAMKWTPNDEFDDFSWTPLNDSPNRVPEARESPRDEENDAVELILAEPTEIPSNALETTDSESEIEDEERSNVSTMLNALSLQGENVSCLQAQKRCQTGAEAAKDRKMPILIGQKYFQLKSSTSEPKNEALVGEEPSESSIESQFGTLFGPSASKPTAANTSDEEDRKNRDSYEKQLAASNAAYYRNLTVDKTKPSSSLRRGIDIGRNTNLVLRPRLD